MLVVILVIWIAKIIPYGEVSSRVEPGFGRFWLEEESGGGGSKQAAVSAVSLKNDVVIS